MKFQLLVSAHELFKLRNILAIAAYLGICFLCGAFIVFFLGDDL